MKLILQLVLAIFLTASSAVAADVSQASRLYKNGDYLGCIELTSQAIEQNEYSETWRLLKIKSEMALGRYAEALATLDTALLKYRSSIRLRWLGRDVCRFNGQSKRAGQLMDEIGAFYNQAKWRYSDPENQVVLGRYVLLYGADPKDVLRVVYARIKERSPSYAEVFLASGQLALEKHDYGLAAEEFDKAVKIDLTNADAHFGLAQAYAPSDSERSQQALETALKRNSQHVDSLLFIVDGHIDAERYADAKQVLQRIFDVHPTEPRGWAYRSVLAHLENELDREKEHRQKALSGWQENPEVDFLIGKKLSQKYRFAEGASYQRRALQLDSSYLPAKIQLSQDLLRLGEEAEGWGLADEVSEVDGYNVVAHNLVTLQENIEKFAALSRGGFVVKMDRQESQIYGEQVLQLLERAKEQLCSKYEVEIQEPVVVEIFPKQQDFAIRTFGLPGGAGFLGVCFGRVITMNSPASQGQSPSNWQSVLWHEFCHVVTLNKTNNKMPRWLSEGISVYEEKLADPTWGQSMNPQYREMLLGDDLTPVSRLSSAFLKPKSPVHLQLAYYESSLVVEYLVEQFGLETLKQILVDLGVGMPINESLRRYAGSLESLDSEFAKFARARAQDLAPQLDFEKVEFGERVDARRLEAWYDKAPTNYWVLQRYAQQLMAEERWEDAKQPLQKLIEQYPDSMDGSSGYAMLAVAHRQLGETREERQVLEQLAALDADAVDVYMRLMELWAVEENWQETAKNARRMLAVNPLLRAPHRFLAQAAERTGDQEQAITALRSLSLMAPIDPADTHFRLAKLLHEAGQLDLAKRHLLRSLEEAPRYRQAHRRLLEIVRQSGEVGEPQQPHDKSAASREPARR